MILAQEIMSTKFTTVPVAMTIGDLVDVLQRAHIHAAPVLSASGELVGIVTQEDALYGTMGDSASGEEQTGNGGRIRSRSGLLEIEDLDVLSPDSSNLWSRPVSDIMTEPAMSVDKDSTVLEVCDLMWSLRIHHLPVTDDGQVVGMISSLDVCRAIAEGKSLP